MRDIQERIKAIQALLDAGETQKAEDELTMLQYRTGAKAKNLRKHLRFRDALHRSADRNPDDD